MLYSTYNRILELIGSNWIKERKLKWWPVDSYNKACGRVEAKQDRLTLSNIGGVFVIICVGILCSCFALYFEFIYFKHKLRCTVDPIAIEDDCIEPESQQQITNIEQYDETEATSPYNWKCVQQRIGKSLPHLFAEVHHEHKN